MKLKVGDKKTVKNLKWYEENKNSHDEVVSFGRFTKEMSDFCGKEITIDKILKTFILIKEDNGKYLWDNSMFEDDSEEVIFGVTKNDIKKMYKEILKRDEKYGDFED